MASMGVVHRIEPLLPVFRISQAGESLHLHPIPVFDYVGSLSEEASALLWVLETSTDPRLVESAAEMVCELQWPGNLDVRPALKRLDDTFKSCVDLYDLREGMAIRATACIRAFWLLDMVTDDDRRTTDLWTYDWDSVHNASGDLQSIEFWTHRPLNLGYEIAPITPWSLRFIAARNPPEDILPTFLKHFDLGPSDSADANNTIFADFLYCLHSFLSTILARDRAVLDKR
jgi:hypothetical protein